MELIPSNRILYFNADQIICIRKQYNLDKPGDLDQAIDILETWIQSQHHFMKKDLPRNYLERVILASKGSLERAKNKLDKICTLRTVMPAFFGENLTNNRYENLHNAKSILFPKSTDENCRVYLMKGTGSSYYTSEFLLNYFRYLVLVCEFFMAHDYSDGLIIIVDYNEVNVKDVIKALNLTDFRQIIAIITEGFPMRLKEIHMMTPSKAIDTLMTIIKQFVSPKIGKRIYVHRDISTLYQYVPKDMFPMEYGGKEKSLDELCDALRNEITGKDFMNYIKEMNKAKTDESCRETDTFNDKYFGMPGSFRTLNVD